MSLLSSPAAFMAVRQGSMVRLIKVSAKLLKLGAAQERPGAWAHRHRHDVGQVDLCTVGAAELDFGFLARFFQALQCHGILAQVQSAILILEFCDEPLDDDWSKSSPPRWVSPSVDSTSKTPSPQFENADVVRATTQVKHHNFLIWTSCPGRRPRQRGGLVDDPLHFESGDFTCFFGGLTLAVVEVGGTVMTAPVTSVPGSPRRSSSSSAGSSR